MRTYSRSCKHHLLHFHIHVQMYKNYLCLHKDTCILYTRFHNILMFAIRSIAADCILMWWKWTFPMQGTSSSLGMAVGYPTYKLSWKMPPSIARFFGGFFLGTLRLATFKLAFLAGGPPMPNTWEWNQRKIITRFRSGVGFSVRTLAEWMEVGIPGDVVFFWATKKEIRIRCQMKLQYLHLAWALRKANRIRKTKNTKIKRASNILGGEKTTISSWVYS